jgi:glycerol-3-phosphate dehydrogenase (NAD(P)+)
MPPSISILGAGSWGTALAILAARNGCQTVLWAHNATQVSKLRADQQNTRYLPGLLFPENLAVTDNLEHAVRSSSVLLISVPSHAFRNTLVAIKPYLNLGTPVVWATKGFDPDQGNLLSYIVSEVLGADFPMAVISGPSFAREVASNLPTAITIAATEPGLAEKITTILHNSRFRTYTNNDLIGVQVGGAVKNVLAIAAGIADGLGFGANTRAALITRGLTEIMRLGLKLGGKQETFMGLAGLGDLILTCTDNQSRNRRFGLALGSGQDFTSALSAIDQEVEGIFAAKETYMLAQKLNLDMPITEQTYKVLYENLAPQAAVEFLLSRDQKPEVYQAYDSLPTVCR